MTESNPGGTATWCPKCGGTHPPTEACPSKGARVGSVLDGKYALVRLLGEGGMGEVYEARHTKIGRGAAVKFLHGQFARRPEVAQRFENEARAAGEVQHENIAGVYDVGALPDGTQYLVMELLEGEDLDRLLRRERSLPLPRAADLLTQACQGLAVVHHRGIVHRDLKPANLFLTKRANGTDLVKILDFGIAKLRRPEGDASSTGTGVAIGTAHYMSPEQARGDREIGARSDVYALGVIFYELLSGRRPHDGDSLLQILHNILTRPPRPLEEVCPNLPRDVYDVVRKAMARHVADRFAGVDELAAALAPFSGSEYRPLRSEPLGATRIETAGGVRVGGNSLPNTGGAAPSVVGVTRNATPPTLRGKGLALAASALAVVALGVAAIAWTHGKTGAPPPTASASGASLTSPSPAPAPFPASSGADSEAAVPAVLPLSGQGSSGQAVSEKEVSGHSDEAVSTPDPRKNHRPSGGPPFANRGSEAGAGPSHGGPSHSTAVSPTVSASPTKLDCTQTYTIDSEGNKHFRPECFPPK